MRTGVGVVGRWGCFRVWAVLAWLLLPLAPASAAELKISLSELARIVSATLGGAKLRLHNVPGGAFDFSAGSSITLGSTSVPIPIAAKTFEAGGAVYGYYVNDINSNNLTVSAVPGALRFVLTFDDKGAEVIGRCVSGLCIADSALPEVQWVKPAVTIDLAPAYANGSLSLVAKKVDVGGTFAPDCAAASGLFSGSVCKLVLPQARKSTANLKTDLNSMLMAQINAPDLQAKLSSTLKTYLKLGPVGEVRFTKVAVDSDTVTLTFCLSCQAVN